MAILLYSHDTFGLGHLRRSLAIAGQIAHDLPQANQLLITGSMAAGAFDLPPRLDLIKLPALSKRSSGRYKARALPLTLNQTITWREQMYDAILLYGEQAVFGPVAAYGMSPVAAGKLIPCGYLRRLRLLPGPGQARQRASGRETVAETLWKWPCGRPLPQCAS